MYRPAAVTLRAPGVSLLANLWGPPRRLPPLAGASVPASLAWTNPDSRPEPLERVDDAGASLDEVPGAGPVQFLQGESPRKRWWLRGPLSRVNGGRFHNTAGTHLLFPLS